jgi:hypothetical protein
MMCESFLAGVGVTFVAYVFFFDGSIGRRRTWLMMLRAEGADGWRDGETVVMIGVRRLEVIDFDDR